LPLLLMHHTRAQGACAAPCELPDPLLLLLLLLLLPTRCTPAGVADVHVVRPVSCLAQTLLPLLLLLRYTHVEAAARRLQTGMCCAQ
jgi:hypothetical protein